MTTTECVFVYESGRKCTATASGPLGGCHGHEFSLQQFEEMLDEFPELRALIESA